MLRFEWDENKNRANRKKHGVWFEEAIQCFDDAQALLFFDKDHSDEEDRFLLLGVSGSGRVLVISHCEASEGHSVIRIISARKAKPQEVKTYEERV